ncbi:MAG: hypothetical protein DDT36_01681 [Firmicutes bacterium]|nr:hypothetical protein [Bacillota bacterium]MBT9158663.1 hypothetical protein [Bacillota bacterium]
MYYSPRQMTVIALVATTTAASGYLLYTAIPVPGLKFALLAPLLSLMVALPLALLRQRGVILATCLVLAAVMGLFNFLMSLAIVMTGVITEGLSWLIFRGANTTRAIRATAATFPTISLVITAMIAHFVTGSRLLNVTWPVFGALVLLTQALGLLGAWVAEQVLLPRITLARQRFERE